MDVNLLKEREAFKKRAYALPVVEKRKEKKNEESPPKKKVKKEGTVAASSKGLLKDPLSYKSMSGTSQYNFSVLAKIVKYMKQRHLEGDNEPLSLEDILDETNQLDLGVRQKTWLQNEALNNNPKVVINEEGKYAYKPTFQLKDKKSLLRMLDKHDQKGLGGIHWEDIQESLPNAEKSLNALKANESIIVITRPVDKKKIVFYKDKSMQFKVDEEFQKLWRSVAVDGIDETKIDNYLQKQGITSMQDLSVKKMNPIQKRKKPTSRKPRLFKKHNEHMGDILQDYDRT